MAQRLILATGDCVEGNAQRVHLSEDSFVSVPQLCASLNGVLKLEPASAIIEEVALFDNDSQTYLPIRDTGLLPQKKMKLRVTCSVPQVPPPQQQPADNTFTASAAPTADGSLLRAMERFMAERDAILFDAIGTVAPHAQLELGRLATASQRANRTFLEDPSAALDALQTMQNTANSATARKRMETKAPARQVEPRAEERGSPPQARKAAKRPPSAHTATMNNANNNDDMATPPPSAHGNVAPPPPPAIMSPRQIDRSLLNSAPSTITVFCVYSGTTTQRAKAVNVNRTNPDFKRLLQTLETKFKSSLTLGYVDPASGEFTELGNGDQLGELIKRNHQNADSITLHCWRTGGYRDNMVSDDDQDHQQQQPTNASSRPTTPYNHHSYVRMRPSSAMSARSGRSHTRPWAGKSDLGFPADPETQKKLFDELDLDHSGVLDVNEFRTYFDRNHDSMGINDDDKLFEKLLAETGVLDDGEITFNEFQIVLLKMQQW